MKTTVPTVIFALLIPAIATSGAPVVGRVDDFEDGSSQGWSSLAGHTILPSGGPAGAEDNYLQIYFPTASIPEPFHLGTRNTTTWAGDYHSAGVQAIAMDVNAISITVGPAHLSLRIVLFGSGGAFSSRQPAPVVTGAGWQHLEFRLTRSDLVRVPGGGSDYVDPGVDVDDLTATLRAVDTLLIRHDPAASPTPIGQHPEHILATLGIDNITAVLGSAPAYDTAWTFSTVTDDAYVLDRFEPGDIVLGDTGTRNPTLLLHLRKRYQVTVSDPVSHPFELVASGVSPQQDVVLLSAVADRIGSFEKDADVKWSDNGSGTVAFTLTDRLYNGLTTRSKRPGYRCGLHPSSMRGDIGICTARLASDLNGDCRVDFLDVARLGAEWLENALAQ